MDRLDGLLENSSVSKNRGAHSREASREPRVNFNEHSNRGRTHGSTRGRGNSDGNATGNNRPKNPTNIRGSSIGSRPISNELPTRDAHANGRGDSINWNHSRQERAHASDSDRREVPDPKAAEINDQAEYSRDAAAMKQRSNL